jgi:hypothetical protein
MGPYVLVGIGLVTTVSFAGKLIKHGGVFRSFSKMTRIPAVSSTVSPYSRRHRIGPNSVRIDPAVTGWRAAHTRLWRDRAAASEHGHDDGRQLRVHVVFWVLPEPTGRGEVSVRRYSRRLRLLLLCVPLSGTPGPDDEAVLRTKLMEASDAARDYAGQRGLPDDINGARRVVAALTSDDRRT